MNLGAITNGTDVQSGIPSESELIAFVEACLTGGEEDITVARNSLHQRLGEEAMIDAAAVIANFQRMTPIADGCGIALDEPMKLMTEELRSELGINAFGSADNTPGVLSE